MIHFGVISKSPKKLFIESGKSLTYMIKRVGPKMVP